MSAKGFNRLKEAL